MAAENLRKAKILVLGDTGRLFGTLVYHWYNIFSGGPGVGKTSLVTLICHGEVLSSQAWTIGCNVEVKVTVILYQMQYL